jgi:hypothetical protein
MIKAADLAVSKYSQDGDLIKLLTDAIALALQCNHEVNHSRRLGMKKELHKDYAALGNVATPDPTSEFLFGDLSKLTKDISEANKLAKRVRPNFPQYSSARGEKYGGCTNYGPLASQGNRRFQPYNSQRGRKDF